MDMPSNGFGSGVAPSCFDRVATVSIHMDYGQSCMAQPSSPFWRSLLVAQMADNEFQRPMADADFLEETSKDPLSRETSFSSMSLMKPPNQLRVSELAIMSDELQREISSEDFLALRRRDLPQSTVSPRSPKSPRSQDRSPAISPRDMPSADAERTPSHFDRSPSHPDRSPSMFDRSPSHFDRSPSHFDRSPSHFDRSPSHFDRSPSHFDRSPSKFDRGPSQADRVTSALSPGTIPLDAPTLPGRRSTSLDRPHSGFPRSPTVSGEFVPVNPGLESFVRVKAIYDFMLVGVLQQLCGAPGYSLYNTKHLNEHGLEYVQGLLFITGWLSSVIWRDMPWSEFMTKKVCHVPPGPCRCRRWGCFGQPCLRDKLRMLLCAVLCGATPMCRTVHEMLCVTCNTQHPTSALTGTGCMLSCTPPSCTNTALSKHRWVLFRNFGCFCHCLRGRAGGGGVAGRQRWLERREP